MESPVVKMAITSPFGGEVEGSTPSRRAAFISQLIPAPCRLCGGPSYLTDDLGAIHACCQLNWDGRRCVACDTSESLNREHRRRGIRQPWKEVKAEGLDG